jgi:mono/diheme cytochrome c family protein
VNTNSQILPRVLRFVGFLGAAALMFGQPQVRAQDTSKAPEKQGSSSSNIENGKKLFTSYGCYECHGREGQGSPYSGARLAPHPIALRAFIAYVRQPAGQMPPYTAKVASESELADIWAFLNSLPPPPPAKSIPLLK